MIKAIAQAFREGPWWLIALKVGALLSFCGGPMVVVDWLKVRIDGNVAFAVGFFPAAALIFGVYSLRNSYPDRWDHWMVSLGCIGAIALVPMNIFGISELVFGRPRADAGLITLGIAIGTLFVTYYFYASYKFFRLRRSAA